MDDRDLEGAFLHACCVGLLIWIVFLPAILLLKMLIGALAWFAC